MWVPAYLIRGGTSKGLFFNGSSLPRWPKQQLDNFFLRALGSPDPYGEQIDGLGGGSSSTSKIAIITRSTDPSYDVEYLFGQVDIKRSVVDYTGSCGNMAAGVGLFALYQKMVPLEKRLANGWLQLRVLQRNLNKTIVVRMPCNESL